MLLIKPLLARRLGPRPQQIESALSRLFSSPESPVRTEILQGRARLALREQKAVEQRVAQQNTAAPPRNTPSPSEEEISERILDLSEKESQANPDDDIAILRVRWRERCLPCSSSSTINHQSCVSPRQNLDDLQYKEVVRTANQTTRWVIESLVFGDVTVSKEGGVLESAIVLASS